MSNERIISDDGELIQPVAVSGLVSSMQNRIDSASNLADSKERHNETFRKLRQVLKADEVLYRTLQYKGSEMIICKVPWLNEKEDHNVIVSGELEFVGIDEQGMFGIRFQKANFVKGEMEDLSDPRVGCNYNEDIEISNTRAPLNFCAYLRFPNSRKIWRLSSQFEGPTGEVAGYITRVSHPLKLEEGLELLTKVNNVVTLHYETKQQAHEQEIDIMDEFLHRNGGLEKKKKIGKRFWQRG